MSTNFLGFLRAAPGRRLLALFALMLAGTAIEAQTTVATMAGGDPNISPKYQGYRDGATKYALFHTPAGMAMDSSGQYLYVADRDNSAIRVLDLIANNTATLIVPNTNLVNHPIAVAVDTFDDVYVLNNVGSLYTIDANLYSPTYGAVITNALNLVSPKGMALDYNNNIYVTVSGNKLIRIAPFSSTVTTVATIPMAGTSLQGITVKHNGLIAACDAGRNGIYLIDPNTGIVTTNAGFHGTGDFITNSTPLIAPANTAKFNMPMCVVEAGNGTLIVSDYGNNRLKAVLPSGVVSNLFGVTSQYWGGSYPGWYDGPTVAPDSYVPNVQCRGPYGVALGQDGTIYDTELYYELIRKATGSSLPAALPPPPLSPASLTATAGYGTVSLAWAASTGATNYNIERSTTSGAEQTIASVSSSVLTYTDTNVIDGTTYYYAISALNVSGQSGNSPEAVATPLLSPIPTNLVVVTTNYGLISLSWAPSAGATSYDLQRSPSSGGPYNTIAITTSTVYQDNAVTNGTFYYYVVSAINPGGTSSNSLEVIGRAPLPPVPNPQIGYVDFPATASPEYSSVFHPFSSAIFNNDAYIVIEGTPLTQTYFTIGVTETNSSGITTNPPDPTAPGASVESAPSGYQDGLASYNELEPYLIGQPQPDETIKAVGEESGAANSAIVQARIQYVTANPNIIGANAAAFTIYDITTGAQVYYTVDGTDPSPTNATAVNLGVSLNSSNNWPVSVGILANTVFKARAYKANYQPSQIVSNVFTVANFQPTTITFGFGVGEASSSFIASAGQTFYAPVTLNLVAAPTIYTLQFNLTVTNGVTNSGPPIAPGTFGFDSLMEKPIPGVSPVAYEYIPPAEFVGLDAVPNPVTLPDGSTGFSSLLFTNASENLLGVGWIERAGATNLYDTTKQTLITYSQAHDTLFNASGGKVIVGGFNVAIPLNAQTNQTYQIQIGRPTATLDGIGGANSDAFISAPTNNGTGPGVLDALQTITIGQYRYIVGSTYPFRWFNAGDFGSSNIVNADVVQVFEAAVYFTDSPADQAPGSDFFDTMDSSGNIGALDNNPSDPNYSYYTNSEVSYISTYGSYNPLFDGNDTTINQDIFGDGFLDVDDVYVTFRRSLDPSLTWFRRFWNNGVRVADAGGVNQANHALVKSAPISSGSTTAKPAVLTSGTVQPSVAFTAGDIIGSAGSTVQVPITATISGSYPLRVLLLNLTVTPLDGSPALTTPVAFNQTATVLGAPYITESRNNGNYSAAWLNSSNATSAGLTGTAVIGTLSVTIPAGAGPNAAYAVHFDHASASPNGLASFPNTKLTGVLTTTIRTNSSYADGIPDSWRLRWFGTTNNLLSVSNACPSGDGVINWKKYVAGVDPNVANDFPSVKPTPSVPSGYSSAIYWPTVNGKQYVIERSATLFGGAWSNLSTNTGTGGNMEFDDTYTNKAKFYRVLILQ